MDDSPDPDEPLDPEDSFDADEPEEPLEPDEGLETDDAELPLMDEVELRLLDGTELIDESELVLLYDPELLESELVELTLDAELPLVELPLERLEDELLLLPGGPSEGRLGLELLVLLPGDGGGEPDSSDGVLDGFSLDVELPELVELAEELLGELRDGMLGKLGTIGPRNGMPAIASGICGRSRQRR